MILLHIVTSDQSLISSITDYLIEEHLALDVLVTENTYLRKRNLDSSFVNEKQFVITAKTKALLFETINQKLREKYSYNMPILYSVPIVNMDWEQIKKLQSDIAKV